jgi:hypothetical protein
MDEGALVLNLAEHQPAQVPRAIRRRISVNAGFGFIKAMRAVLVNMRIPDCAVWYALT